jgi:hypothetical protein
MLSTIELNYELRVQTEKVHNIDANHLLTAELTTFQLAIPESAPEDFFSVSLTLPEDSSKVFHQKRFYLVSLILSFSRREKEPIAIRTNSAEHYCLEDQRGA